MIYLRPVRVSAAQLMTVAVNHWFSGQIDYAYRHAMNKYVTHSRG